jgi:acyl transferase domain-containing protein/acyl-CoA synthetase (AMP-forming)/AMP-acid ligase II/acyl carrier protein
VKSSVSRSEFASLVEVVRFRASDMPDRTALVFLDNGETELKRITYGQLDQKARAVAVRLAAVTTPGDRVLLLYPSSVEFPWAFLGCLYAGVIAVPAYPPRRNRSLNRLQAIITDSGARIALTTARTMADLAERWAGLTEIAPLQFVATDLETEIDDASWNPPALGSETLAFLQYTSGSTGEPKGVMVSHGNIVANLKVIGSIRESSGARDDLILASWLPMFHDMGLVGALLWPLFEGGMLISMEPAAFIQKPVRWLQAISKYRADVSPAPNSAFDLCVRKVTEQQREGLDLSSWQLAFNGAEPVRHETIERFTAAFQSCGFRPETMYPCYGMAEATLLVTGGVAGELPVRVSLDSVALESREAVPPENVENSVIKVGCGRTRNEHTVRIVDPETRLACAPDQIGEIWLSGPSVGHGYWNRTELSEAMFEAHLAGESSEPFLRTGDLGFLRGEELFVAGRLKDLIIISGRNHYPQDIEQTLEECHPALAPNASAAFSVEVDGEERLVAACEIRREHLRRFDLDELATCARRAVAEEHELELHAILFLKPLGMPRTSSGKIQRHACRTAFVTGAGLDVLAQWQKAASADPAPESMAFATSPNKTAIERWLVERVAAKLNISSAAVDLRSPFTRYGLESRDAITLSGELQEWLGCSLPPTLVYDYPNIEALAAHLVHETSASISFASAGANTPVAIIGLGCRFPGADSPESYWKLLVNGVDAVKPGPRRGGLEPAASDSSAAVSSGGYLDHVDLFDADFFGISRREAELMDPQHRLLMEVAWEALEHAGIAPHSVAGTNTAVAIGISNVDYSRLRVNGPLATDPYLATGNSLSIAANRLSYLLDLRGPSWAVDTACSSSLVAVQQACRSLQVGESHLALAGGVNLILNSQLSTVFAKAGMLSPDGRCKTFDAEANGYVRGEGAGMLVLKRLDDAERDGDNILAVIRGAALSQDGRSNGLTAPNGPAQQAAIWEALRLAGVAAGEISYVEAHGTGTPLGDPIELNALAAVLNEGRREDDICWVGSVKTNIGHLESAAGIAGIIKVVLALVNETVPPHLQLRQLSPHIELGGTAIRIPTAPQPWRRGKRRLAGVSSFGFGGTNAHVIIEEGPAPKAPRDRDEQPVELLALSARTPAALQAVTIAYAGFLRSHPEVSLADFAYTATVGRSHFPFRSALVAASTEEAVSLLESYQGTTKPAGTPRIAFLFTGQGAQYRGMGRQLFETHVGFRRILERCDELLRDHLPKSLLEVLFGPGNVNERDANDGEEKEIDQTLYAQPALFAIEYALACVWREWGIVPSAVLGHSVGEYAAACFAGVFSLEDGLRMIAERARLMQRLPKAGSMLSVFAGEQTCLDAMAEMSSSAELLSIAAVNGPAHVVLSGDSAAIREIESILVGRDIGVQALKVSHAFHSQLMQPMVEDFGRVAAGVHYQAPTVEVISSVTGVRAGDEIATADYWRGQVLAPVRFSKAMESLGALKLDAFIEIGSKPVLTTMARGYLDQVTAEWLPSLEADGQNTRSMFASLGKLYTLGAPVNWRAVHDDADRRRISLPTYPFERQSYWLEEEAKPIVTTTAPAASLGGHPLLGVRLDKLAHLPGTCVWETRLDGSAADVLAGHRLMGSTVVPYSAFVEMALAAAPQACPGGFHQIEDLSLHHPLFISREQPRVIQVVVDELATGKLSFKVFSRAQHSSANGNWTLCASAVILGNGRAQAL